MKKILIGLLMGMWVVMGAQAEDVGVNIDGKNIVVTDSSVSFYEDALIANKASFENGIFVAVEKNLPNNDFPNAKKIIEERLTLFGFKIADQLDKSSVSITILASGSLKMNNAEKESANSSIPNSSQIVSNSGGAVAAAINHGIPGFVGYVAGGLFGADNKLQILGSIHYTPFIDDGVFGKKIASKNKKSTGALLKLYYKLDDKNKASDDVVLKMAIDQWIYGVFNAHKEDIFGQNDVTVTQ